MKNKDPLVTQALEAFLANRFAFFFLLRTVLGFFTNFCTAGLLFFSVFAILRAEALTARFTRCLTLYKRNRSKSVKFSLCLNKRIESNWLDEIYTKKYHAEDNE